MTPDEIRATIITAIASDDYLVDLLVLKGGNALELVHHIGQRASLDMDFSTATDFDDINTARDRLFGALRNRFDAHGLILFDETFAPRPKGRILGERWGGYNAEFKLIPRELANELNLDLDSMRRQALATGPSQHRKFRIEISPFEYCDGKQSFEIDHYTSYVYSVAMIAVEKLRAICQQSPLYPERAHPAPRARDFYDIYAAVTEGGVDFSRLETHDLVRKIFAAKNVDLKLILDIANQREFHRADWPSVENAVRHRLRQFDFYFEFVLAQAQHLDALLME